MINIPEMILAEKAKKISRQPCKSNRASSIGHWVPELGGCMRLGVYERTRWEDKELIDARVQTIFDEGNNQEKCVLRDMAEAGIQAIEQQSSFEWANYNITGHLDFVIVDDGAAIPGEIKSMAPHIWSTIQNWNDMVKSDYAWIPPYCAQITLYMLHKNIDRGLFILKNKSTGALKQVDAQLDYELGEAILRTAEAVNKHVNAVTLPDKITDMDKCSDCRFRHICQTEINFNVPLQIAQDPEFEKRLDRYARIEGAASEAKDSWEVIRSRAIASSKDGVLSMLCGKWKLEGKTTKNGQFRLKVEQV